ncbi:hypothetical protein L6452_09759 [Arctium lappa]|uniref:Uncharacterized protein n=1 Tax=Arctium lappa TaxID=4217 RepID=A0ACB9DLD4_ARCLA|nr:hypothetical protein L6452_09759 [Arctium lappa]
MKNCQYLLRVFKPCITKKTVNHSNFICIHVSGKPPFLSSLSSTHNTIYIHPVFLFLYVVVVGSLSSSVFVAHINWCSYSKTPQISFLQN